jgi:hypothetical protein
MTDSASKDGDPVIKTIKTGTCPSLSGRTQLTFEFGVDDRASWHVRIPKSSGTGFFSKDWVPLEHIQQVLATNGDKPIICHTLGPLFAGKSVNTAGFLLAVLKHVELVQVSAQDPRTYVLHDGKAFFAALQSALTGTANKKKA